MMKMISEEDGGIGNDIGTDDDGRKGNDTRHAQITRKKRYQSIFCRSTRKSVTYTYAHKQTNEQNERKLCRSENGSTRPMSNS